MPKEVTRFNEEARKNRHSPYPIPSSAVEPPLPSSPPQPRQLEECIQLRTGELLRHRELCGNTIISRGRSKRSFRAEYRKCHAMKPTIWNYNETKNKASVSLVHAVARVQQPHGLVDRDILLTGGENNLVQMLLVGKDEHGTTPITYEADCLLPQNMPRNHELVQWLGSSAGAMFRSSSDVSCVKLLTSAREVADSASNHLVVTTRGSDDVRASVTVVDISGPLDFGASPVVDLDLDGDAICLVADFRNTIWTADCDPLGGHVVVGTSGGAVVICTEHAAHSMMLRCASDVLSLEFHQSGNNILCGMRNGAVVNVDTRQEPVVWTGHNSSSISLHSPISCLRSLKVMDQYFLASSMDGKINLYDQRSLQKGPVQSYLGNVNSRTPIELGVDPSEKTVISGGEDCYLRMWDIKSGDMLFKEKFMDSIPLVVCWPRSSGGVRGSNYWDDHKRGVWLGSEEEICYMDWL